METITQVTPPKDFPTKEFQLPSTLLEPKKPYFPLPHRTSAGINFREVAYLYPHLTEYL